MVLGLEISDFGLSWENNGVGAKKMFCTEIIFHFLIFFYFDIKINLQIINLKRILFLFFFDHL